ncbi:Cell division protein FtsQ [Planktothrix serta PCC 8927]|uniref:Cell division protein FtsQ n=1 Tax=Planktothrix serta PCC 8927 TaxID=671068 RepID=A0A7Z9C042_9CYAN|nr:FtsQ-type POTRA domain-containing protein [Planktothrix serta]VXD25319.1 Cell division protein FtsQ [Planktothrix serta PCC 8927]
MTNLGSVSTNELGRRRQQLRRQRRLKLVQVLYQAMVVSSLAGGLFWLINQPIWLIRQPEQLKVEGNQLLSDQAVRSLLPLSYPQSLWKIQPQVLEKTLESRGQIASAHVTRQLFPPSLTINIQERQPIAVAYPPSKTSQTGGNDQIGWLDATGDWMPLENYTELEKTKQLPTLKVIGNVSQYHAYWPQVYQAISRSPIKILVINWEDPSNLILQTEMGTVHLGPYSSKFPEQLRVIDRMRNVPQQLDISQIMYFDLKNPSQPLVQMRPETTAKRTSSEEESTSN